MVRGRFGDPDGVLGPLCERRFPLQSVGMRFEGAIDSDLSSLDPQLGQAAVGVFKD